MSKENSELDKNVTGWLFNALDKGMMQVGTDQAEYVVIAKKWLSDVNNDVLLVTPAEEPKEPKEPSPQN